MVSLVLSVDPGIYHLGLFGAWISDGKITKMEIAEVVDLDRIQHKLVSRHLCTLHHTRTITDYLAHVYQEYPVFEIADTILIERQPPQGLISIEQLVFQKYRSKCTLIHPASVHKFFGLSDVYETRKEQTTQILKRYTDPGEGRVHDIADAYCQLLYWLNSQKPNPFQEWTWEPTVPKREIKSKYF